MVGHYPLEVVILVRIQAPQHFSKLTASRLKTMDWYLYMLLCDQKIYYVGISDNLTNRFIQHINKQSFYTKQFSDLKFVYAEKYRNKSEAAKREQQIKGWSKAKKQLLINGRLGYNTCTGFVEALLAEKDLVSLLRASREDSKSRSQY